MSNIIELSVVILTKNEEENLATALKSVNNRVKDIFVLDSFSTDNTCEIAKEHSVKLFSNKFKSFGDQRRYAINSLPIETDWVLFLDADEIVPNEFLEEVKDLITESKYVAYECKYKFIFLKKWIKHGGYYGTRITRLFRKDKVVISRSMNEHIKANGQVGQMKNDIIHEDKKGFDSWINKHLLYADYEASELIVKQKDNYENLFGSQGQRKRWIRNNIWNKLLPPLIRPFFYFFYRVIIKFGFLDGIRGFIFHFLHALWYPFLIDAKYLIKKLGWDNVRD
tara:strand:+ start:12815 stop:13657 length:843 start_codon:yes stop_codon:yes gene_type:complete